jgi:pyroglutamyl-peptidase
MLRRRSKTPKVVPAAPSSPATSRRRPRPGVQVPTALIIDSATMEEAPKPRAEPRKARDRKQEVVLVTGFDAFCGEAINPSWEICEQLPAEIGGVRVEKCRVPCEFGRAVKTVVSAIERFRPALVICLGQAGGRAHLSVERVAINVNDARIPDNAGAQPIDEPTAPEGPPAYFATLPIKAMVEAMRRAEVPAEVSNSAGTYVCNHLMYGVLHYLAQRSPGVRAGFIHVPYAEAQVLEKPAIAAMAIATMVKGVEAAIVAAHRQQADIRASGGTLD